MNGPSNKLQPVLFAAAVSVILMSVVVVAAITGRLPGAVSSPAVSTSEAPAPAATAPAATTSQAKPQSRLFAARCSDCGVIEEVRAVQVDGEASGLGAAAGGITGAIVGSQIGRGNGRTLATIAGAAGGAYAGNAIEKNTRKRVVYRITLRMDDGSRRVLTKGQQPAFSVGERVRVIDGNALERA